MGAEAVIIFHITTDRLPQLPGRGKFVDIDELRFQASEPSLDHDVIRPAGSPVHTLAYMQLLHKLPVLAAGKLAALVGVEDGRRAETVHGVPYRLQDGLHPQCVGEVPAHDFSAVPIDDGGEIHVAAVEPDVGDVDGPHLV